MIVSPWGGIVAELDSVDENASPAPQIAMAEIDIKFVEKVRKEMPLLRRTDVYPEV